MSSSQPSHERLEVIVSGRVQGVWFRASTRDEAEALGLTGWVRNLPDGRVRAVFEGPREGLEAVLAWCRQGPPGARVEKVDVFWSPARGEFPSFTIAY